MIPADMDAGHVLHFARVDFRNDDRIFGIKNEDRFLHVYVIGKTGTGKSTLIETMAPRRLACELKAFDLRREARPEDRRIERIFEAVAHECRIIIFDVHIEFPDVRREEVHDRAVIGKLPSREHDLIRALLVKLPKPCVSFVRVHGGLAVSGSSLPVDDPRDPDERRVIELDSVGRPTFLPKHQ
jgi:hypothetical protein